MNATPVISFRVKPGSFKPALAMFCLALDPKVKDAKRIVGRHFGGYVRKVAKNSIKRSDPPSPPGKPPHSHIGLLKSNIFFNQDQTGAVIIGPTKLNMLSFSREGLPTKGTIPNALEYGGEAYVAERRTSSGKWTRQDLRRRGKVRIVEALRSAGSGEVQVQIGGIAFRRRRVVIRPRPFMGPAFIKGQDKLPAMWAGSIK